MSRHMSPLALVAFFLLFALSDCTILGVDFSSLSLSPRPCTALANESSLGVDLDGYCMNSAVCSVQHGTASGSCAFGFGVCCIDLAHGGGINDQITSTVGYLANPDFPQPTTHPNYYETPIVLQPGFNKVLLSFVSVDLTPAEHDGTCDVDIVRVQSNFFLRDEPVPLFCGNLTGTNVEFELREPPVTEHFLTHAMKIAVGLSGNRRQRTWLMRVEQISASSEST